MSLRFKNCVVEQSNFGDFAAQEHFATATAMYRDMDMRFWLEQAEAELLTWACVFALNLLSRVRSSLLPPRYATSATRPSSNRDTFGIWAVRQAPKPLSSPVSRQSIVATSASKRDHHAATRPIALYWSAVIFSMCCAISEVAMGLHLGAPDAA